MVLPLQISQISRYYSSNIILDKISLKIKPGSIFGFVGLNGQGKTTLIKIIVDLLESDGGNVKIFEVNKILPKSRENVFYLPEKFQPANNLRAIEFIEFSISLHNKKIDQEELKILCKSLNLEYKYLNKKIKSFSKGMTQKLGLIIAFLSNSDLIILDEPMSGLDSKARIDLKKEILSYQKRGKTIFFSSHILSDIDEICDEIAILNNAKIIFNGSPASFKEKNNENNLEKAFLKAII